MRKAVFVPVAVLLFGAISSVTAMAAITVKSLPTASFSGASVTVTGGNFSGLGNTPLFGTVTASGVATYTCLNPSKHPSPGQNPVQAQPGSSGAVQLPTDKNGRATVPNITASVTAPPTPTADQVGCGGQGSTGWTVQLNTLTATGANLTVTSGNPGPTVFCSNYTKGGAATGTSC
jgi:hypothetical protein